MHAASADTMHGGCQAGVCMRPIVGNGAMGDAAAMAAYNVTTEWRLVDGEYNAKSESFGGHK